MKIDWSNYDYKKEIAVDRYMVEIQLEENPPIFLKYADAWAEAYYEREKAGEIVQLRKDDLDEVKAGLDAKIRAEWQDMKHKNGEKMFLKVPTESLISNWIILRSEYKKAMTILHDARVAKIEAQYVENRLKKAVDAFDNRKFTLDALGNLLVKGIYSYKSRSQEELKDRHSGQSGVEQSQHISKKQQPKSIRKEK